MKRFRVLFILAFILFGFYLYQNTTLFWKTYTDNKYFSIKYPPQFSAKEYSEAQYNKDTNLNVKEDFKSIKRHNPPKVLSGAYIESVDFQVYVWILENKEMAEINNWWNNYNYYPVAFSSPNQEDERPTKDITIDSKAGKIGRQLYNYGEGIFLSESDKIILVYISPAPAKYNKISNQILSTLRLKTAVKNN